MSTLYYFKESTSYHHVLLYIMCIVFNKRVSLCAVGPAPSRKCNKHCFNCIVAAHARNGLVELRSQKKQWLTKKPFTRILKLYTKCVSCINNTCLDKCAKLFENTWILRFDCAKIDYLIIRTQSKLLLELCFIAKI